MKSGVDLPNRIAILGAEVPSMTGRDEDVFVAERSLSSNSSLRIFGDARLVSTID